MGDGITSHCTRSPHMGSASTNSATSPLDAPGIDPGSATFRFGLVSRRTIPRPYEILLNTLISNVQKKQYNDIVIQSPE